MEALVRRKKNKKGETEMIEHLKTRNFLIF